MIKKYIFFLLIFLIPSSMGWYADDYEYRETFNITNGCIYCVINVSTPYNVSDVWIDENNTLLNFNDTSEYGIFINLTKDGNYSIYKYVDIQNSHASLSNGHNTFIQYQGYTTLDFKLSNIAGSNQNIRVIVKFKVNPLHNHDYIVISDTSDFSHDALYYDLLGDGTNYVGYAINNGVFTGTGLLGGFNNAIYHLYEINLTSSNAKFIMDNSLKSTITTNLPNENMGLILKQTIAGGGSEAVWYYGFILNNTPSNLNITSVNYESFNVEIEDFILLQDNILIRNNQYKIILNDYINENILYDASQLYIFTNYSLYFINKSTGAINFKFLSKSKFKNINQSDDDILIYSNEILYIFDKETFELESKYVYSNIRKVISME